MHEVSLVQALFDETDRAIAPHPPESVREITVRIGRAAGLDPSLFRTAFDFCRTERGYAAASLTVIDEPATFRCPNCGAFVGDSDALQCTQCESPARLASGGTLMLERLTLEVSDV